MIAPALDIRTRRGPNLPPLTQITYEIAATSRDRRAAFELVYQNYVRKGLIEPNKYALRVTPYHLLPTTNVFVAKRHREVIGTVTLIGDGELGVPMDLTNEDEVNSLRAAGCSFGETSCLAFRDVGVRDFLPAFIRLTRLMAQHARSYGMEMLVCAAVPAHVRLYKRFLGFEQIGDEKPYPTVCNTRGIACCLDFDRIDRDRPVCYEQYFGVPIPSAHLISQPMSDAEIDSFRPAAERASSAVPVCA